MRKSGLICGLIAAGLLGGCATTLPNQELLQAEEAVAELSSEADVVRLAPVAVAEAQEILSRAQQAEEQTEVSHKARLSVLKAQTARARARQKSAEIRAEESLRRAEDLQLDARERQAELALRRAAEAQRRAREAQRRAEQLRAEAAKERQRAELERERTVVERVRIASVADRLGEVQRTLAELKPRMTERGLVLTLGEVLFGFDSPDLKPYTRRIMDRLAGFLQENGSYSIKVEGHTDSVGEAAYNQQLSQSRAQSVTNSLLNNGLAPNRITTRGYGETRPIASNETAAGRRENRRVEVVIGQ